MDVHIKRVFFECVVVSPNPVEQFLSRKHVVRRFEEVPENLEFLWSEIHGKAINPDLMTLKIHTNRPHSIGVGVVRWGAGLTASKDGAYARNQLPHTVLRHDQIDSFIIFLETLFISG